MNYIVSLSGGKDSTYMLMELLKRDYPIDEIIFCDTGAEFEQMYEHLELVEQKLGVNITVLQNPRGDFFYWAFEHVRTKGKNKGVKGYGLPRVNSGFRWCTSQLKRGPAKSYLNKKYGKNNYIQYIGFALDEQRRMRTDLYPLVYWGVTEQQALEECMKAGFHWGGLYEVFDRVSCWLCPFKTKREKEQLAKHFPALTNRLEQMESRTKVIEEQMRKNNIA